MLVGSTESSKNTEFGLVGIIGNISNKHVVLISRADPYREFGM